MITQLSILGKSMPLLHSRPIPARVLASIHALNNPLPARSAICEGGKEVVAVHESGHAVCWLALWGTKWPHHLPANIHIREGENGVWHGEVLGDDPPGATDLERVMVSRAGPLADSLYQVHRRRMCPSIPVLSNGEKKDYEDISKLLCRDVWDLWDRSEKPTLQLLQDHASAIEVGTQFLLANRTVTGAEFRRAVWGSMWTR